MCFRPFLFFGVFVFGLAPDLSATQQASPPQKTTAAQTPAKPTAAKQPAKKSPSSATKKPAPSVEQPTNPPAPPPKSQPIPEPPAPPKELAFSHNNLVIAAGDRWSYRISSADPSLDGKVLQLTLKEKNEKDAVFTSQLGDGEPNSMTLPAKDLTWFGPGETKRGVFGVSSLGEEYPSKVEMGVGWNSTKRFFSYDSAGRPAGTTGYQIVASYPMTCVVPVGTYSCISLQRFVLNGPLESLVLINPEIPATLVSRLKRPGEGAEELIYELIAVEASGRSATATAPALPVVERQKAIDWMKQNCKFGESSRIVTDLIYLLHEGVRTYPDAALRFAVGSELTKEGKGHVLEWRKGKFSSREMTEEESKTAAPESITRTVFR